KLRSSAFSAAIAGTARSKLATNVTVERARAFMMRCSPARTIRFRCEDFQEGCKLERSIAAMHFQTTAKLAANGSRFSFRSARGEPMAESVRESEKCPILTALFRDARDAE